MTTMPPAADQPEPGTVSGRSYLRTRPRGFVPWRPRAATQVLVDQVQEVLTEYQAYLPLTARQVFYRMVGRHGYEKTERAYERLLELLTRARRARLVPMDAIRDDGIAAHYVGGYSGVAAFWNGFRHQVQGYQRDPREGQPAVVELWVEAAGMVPMVGRVAQEYGADVYSSGGFESLTSKHQAAARIAYGQRPTVVLSIGDYDPSGLSMLDAAAEDVLAFVASMGGQPPAFTRLAVTPAQISEHGLPTAPQKDRDRRGEHMRETVQAEALSPSQLERVVRAGLESVVDQQALQASQRRTEAERAEILRTIDRMGINDL